MEKEDLYKKIESILDNDPELIKAFKAKYLTEAIWKRAIDQEPSLFKHAKDPSYEICLYAVKLDGTNLYDVPKSLVTTKLLKAAIKSAPSVIKYAYDEFLNLMDDQMIVDAVVQQPDLIKKVYERMDYQLIKKIASKEPLVVLYLPFKDEDLICNAIRGNMNVALRIGKLSDKMMDVIDECYPDMRKLIPFYTRKI